MNDALKNRIKEAIIEDNDIKGALYMYARETGNMKEEARKSIEIEIEDLNFLRLKLDGFEPKRVEGELDKHLDFYEEVTRKLLSIVNSPKKRELC